MDDDIKNTIDVDYQDVGDEVYLTAPQVAQKIKDTEIRVRHWADAEVFGDLIGIEKLNGRKRYKESDVWKFAFIKDLLDNKNFKHDQARIYISKHGFKYAEYDSGLVDPKDPLGFQVLASALSVEVHKELDSFKKDLITEVINQVDDRLKKYIMIQGEAINDVFSNTILKVDEVVSEKLEENSKEISNKIDESTEKSVQMQQENKKLLEEVALTVNEMKETDKRLKELLDDPEALKKAIKSVKKENDGIISRIKNSIFNK